MYQSVSVDTELLSCCNSSECFLAMIATFIMELSCHYSAHWFNVGGSHIGIEFVGDCHHILMFTVTYVMKNSSCNNSTKGLQTKFLEQKC
jgi:hypothetical protein